MPIKVTCPKCQGVLHAPDDAGGKKGKCPTCGTVLSIPADAPRAAAPPPPPPLDDGPPDAGFRPAGRHTEPADDIRGTMVPGDARRSSFGGLPKPPVEDRRPAAGRVAPPAFHPPEPRKPSDPFARPGKPAARPGEVGPGLVRAWRKTRGGLWWVQLGQFLYLLPVLGLAGIAIAGNYGAKLPNEPGMLQIDDLRSDHEVKLAVLFAPMVLGLLVTTLGRFGVSNAPRASYTKGLALAAAVGTLLVVLGAAALLVPTGVVLAAGTPSPALLPRPADADTLVVPAVPVQLKVPDEVALQSRPDEASGVARRAGLLALLVFVPLSELWFVVALSRMAGPLGSRPLAARGTRFLVFFGLVAAALLVVGVVAVEDRTAAAAEAKLSGLKLDRPVGDVVQADEVRRAYADYVQANFDKLGDHKPAAQAGVFALAGLFVWLVYFRLVGAARRAIRGWLELNLPATAV